MHFGRGIQASLNARDAHNGKRYRGGDIASAFKDGHLRGMTPRVCSALRDSKPSNLSVDTDGDDPVLNWDAPGYTEAPTGYRILRGAAGQEPTVLVANTGSTSTTWSDEDPTPGDIAYTVQAMYDGYASPDSNSVEATIAESSTATHHYNHNDDHHYDHNYDDHHDNHDDSSAHHHYDHHYDHDDGSAHHDDHHHYDDSSAHHDNHDDSSAHHDYDYDYDDGS